MSWFETALILFVNLLISFAAGCATCKSSYVKALRTKQALVICLVMQFGLRPAVVFGLLKAFGVPDGAAVGCMLCAIAPGGNGSNLLEIIFRGNVELGIVCTLCSSLFSSVAIPLDFWLYVSTFTEENFTFVTMPWGDISSAIACVCVGALAGAAVRYKDDRLGAKLENRTAAIGLVLLVTAVVMAVVSNVAALKAIPTSAWLACIFPCPIALTLSYFAARRAGLSVLDARTVATEVGECNIGVAYAILLLLYNDKDEIRKVFSGIVAYTVFNEIYIFAIAFYWRVIKPLNEVHTCAIHRDNGGGAADKGAGIKQSSTDDEEEPPAPDKKSTLPPTKEEDHLQSEDHHRRRYLLRLDESQLEPPSPPQYWSPKNDVVSAPQLEPPAPPHYWSPLNDIVSAPGPPAAQ